METESNSGASAVAFTQVADTLSQSLLFSLGRQYLDVPFDQAAFLQPVGREGPPAEVPHFLRLEQVGDPPAGSLQQPFTALQTALAACHDPGRYTLLFVVASSGQENRVYLGVRGRDAAAQPYAFVDTLGHFLEGNWSGTRLARCDYRREITPHILYPISRRMRHAVALTGIPSLKPGDHPGYPQSLDRLLRGLRGRSFMYVIVAEPMGQAEINGIITLCRDLAGRVHTLTSANLTETLTRQESLAQGRTETRQESQAVQSGQSRGSTRQVGLNLGLGLGVLSVFFPPAAFLAAVSPSVSYARQNSESTSTTTTLGVSAGDSLTLSQSLSAAQAWGREYLNLHAQAAEAQLAQMVTRFEHARTLGCWNVGAYLLAEDTDTALQGGAQLRALLSGVDSAMEPIRVHDLARAWTAGPANAQASLADLMQLPVMLVDPTTGARLSHPLGAAFDGLSTPLNTQELALLVNLPRREVAGVRVMPTADFSLNPPPAQESDLPLGCLLQGDGPTPLTYRLAPATLAKHVLVTGITGSGKSTTCRRLLGALRARGIPFLVVEPAKEEYVAWAMELNAGLAVDSPERIAVYMPGAETWRGQPLTEHLALNPFDVVWLAPDHTPQVLAHIDRLKSLLNAAFPMQEALPILLEDALFTAYSRPRDWLGDALPPFDAPRPTLSNLLDQIGPVVRGKGYEERVTANLTAALTTRVQSLRRGWKGQLFDRPRSTPWADLFDRPAVVNLARLGDDADKSLAMSLLLLFLYEYRQAQQETAAAAGPLRHLMAIEEAHRILTRPVPAIAEQAHPQAKTAEMFSHVLSEIRAYGQGLLVVDQVPARLVPDAVKNTNLKIVHRLVAEDDRDAMAACMSLTPEQAILINRLRPGQAIVYGDQDDLAAWLQIAM